MAAIEAMDDAEFIVASGSLPPGVPTDIYARIARMAKTKKAKFMVDASGEALKHAVEAGVYLIKPNAGELSQLAGKKEMQAGEIMETAREIIKKGKSKIMVVSMGAAGAMLVTETLSEMITPPPVERKSTVGAGDSMVGGMVYYLSLGKSLAEAVQYGVACGTAATIHPGTALCTKADADRLYELMQNKK
jgi:6-phosphofructokinase 2